MDNRKPYDECLWGSLNNIIDFIINNLQTLLTCVAQSFQFMLDLWVGRRGKNRFLALKWTSMFAATDFRTLKANKLCAHISLVILAFVCSFHMQFSLSLKVAVLYETQFACASRRSKGKLAFYSQANLGKFYSFFMLIHQTFGTSKSCQLGLVTCLSRAFFSSLQKEKPQTKSQIYCSRNIRSETHKIKSTSTENSERMKVREKLFLVLLWAC